MKTKKLLAFSVLVSAMFAVAANAQHSGNDKLGPYKLVTTVTTPGEDLVGFDISWGRSRGRQVLPGQSRNRDHAGKAQHYCDRHETQ